MYEKLGNSARPESGREPLRLQSWFPGEGPRLQRQRMWCADPPPTNRGISAIMILEVLLSTLICVQISCLRNSKVSGYVLEGTAQLKEKNTGW